MTPLGRKLILVGGACLISLVLGEVAARIALPLIPDPPGTGWIKDPDCAYLLRPTERGALPEDDPAHINTLGFRDRNHDPRPEFGVNRLLGVGDSFVYSSVALPDNFLRVTADAMGAKGYPTEVILAGVPGWHSGNYAGWLRGAGLGLDPDMVVVNFYIGNDVTGLSVGGRVIRGTLYPSTSPQPLRHALRQSYLFLLFETQVLRPLRNRGMGDHDPARLPDQTPVNDTYLYIASQYLPVFQAEPDEAMTRLWNETEANLAAIDDLCREADVPWLLVLIPDETQVDFRVRKQVLERLEKDPLAYDFTAPQNRLTAFAERRGFPVLDLLPVLRQAHSREGRQYLPNDTHWNEKGNRNAGRALAKALIPLTR